jgi:hypothetical protein
VGWDEFQSILVLQHLAVVYDDAPGCNQTFIGSPDEARDDVARADPRTSGWAGATP